MKCRKCRAEIPEGSRFCCQCGANQQVSHRTKARGNGLGSVYQRPNRTWVAVKTVGYKLGDDGKKRRVTRSKSGFKTKREALEYLPLLTGEKAKPAVTFQGLYGMWLPTHQATKSTLDCYKAAYKYFLAVWYTKLDDISIDDLQECLDDCPKGKRTRENIKALCQAGSHLSKALRDVAAYTPGHQVHPGLLQSSL